MAQYKIPDAEDLLPCPYDNTHMVRAKRFPYHLMKCRKNYSGTDYAVCPFNAKHEMPRPELRFHTMNCTDRVVLEQDIIYAQQRRNDEVPAPVPMVDFQVPRATEDWDRDLPAVPKVGIDPNFLKEKNVIRNLTGMTPAEKKAYHKLLRVNLERKKQGLPPLREEDMEKKEPGEADQPKIMPSGMRLPQKQPEILQYVTAPKKPSETAQQQPTSVFAYSLKLAGIGRGRPVNPQPTVPLVNGTGPGTKRNEPRIAANIYSGQPNKTQAGQGELAPGVKPTKPTVDDNAKILQRLTLGRGTGRGLTIDGSPGGVPARSVGRGVSFNPAMGPVFHPKTVGRGQTNQVGAPTFIVPTVNGMSPANPQTTYTHTEAGSDNESVGSVPGQFTSHHDPEETRRREIRKLQKKLRGVEALEMKPKDQLSSIERQKLLQKQAIVSQLAEFGFD